MSARVYLPATLAVLADLVRDLELPATAERFAAPDDTEESEYAALMAAAGASRELLAGPGRRVVVVAELANADGPVPLDRVVAVHVDTDEDADPDDDLAWFATQEIPDLLG